MPANATHPLVEAVKQSGARPIFGELDQGLGLYSRRHIRIAWLQPPLGLPGRYEGFAGVTVLITATVCLGQYRKQADGSAGRCDHLWVAFVTRPQTAGALLVFNGEALYARFVAESGQIEPIVYADAATQLERLQTIGPRQESALRWSPSVCRRRQGCRFGLLSKVRRWPTGLRFGFRTRVRLQPSGCMRAVKIRQWNGCPSYVRFITPP